MIDLGVLVQQCASGVDYPIAHAIVKQESGFNPFAINVNKASQIKRPQSYGEAVYKAKDLIARGYNIDMGLGQINSSNLKWLNLSVEQVFDPCTNVKALKTVYLTCYDRAGENGLGTRIQRALSCYNTGNIRNGFFNGYVNKVTNHLNNFIAGTSGINRKSLPNNSEDLAIYASSLSSNNEQKPSINNEENKNQVPDVVAEPQYSTWDIFKDF